MIWVKRIGAVLLLAVVGFLVWSWLAGPIRAKRDIAEFAGAMQDCTVLDQDYKNALNGVTMNRAVEGPEGETCKVRMDIYGPQYMYCKFPMQIMPDLAASFAAGSKNIGFFGGFSLVIDTNSDDPLYLAMNSPACELMNR